MLKDKRYCCCSCCCFSVLVLALDENQIEPSGADANLGGQAASSASDST